MKFSYRLLSSMLLLAAPFFSFASTSNLEATSGSNIAVSTDSVVATEVVKAEPKLKISPTGRLYVNAAGLSLPTSESQWGVAIPEARIGLKATYDIYTFRIDVGFDYGKVSLKDVAITAQFTPKWSLKVGHFYQPFGLQATNTGTRASIIHARPSAIFDPSRSIGIMAMYEHSQWFAQFGVAGEPKAAVLTTNELGKTGYSASTRLLYRPFREDSKFLHIGWSGAWVSPEFNSDPELNHNSFTFTATLPTTISKITAFSEVVTDAHSMFKFTPELLASYGRFALESQYYYGRVFVKDGLNGGYLNGSNDFVGQGVYAKLHVLLLGNGYKYKSSEGKIDRLAPKSLNMVFNYNYLELNSTGDIKHRMNDASVTLSWYINRYLTWRLRGGYTWYWEHMSQQPIGYNHAKPNGFGGVETSFQLLF